MTDTKHTPTPFRASPARKSSNFGDWQAFVQAHVPDPCKPGSTYIKTVAKTVGDSREEAEANAVSIVRACNAHYDLIAHLRKRIEQTERYLSRLSAVESMGGSALLLRTWLEEDRAALAKAQEGEG